MKRYKHTLSHYRMVTANMGEVFPVSCVPVLPGDTMQGSTSALIRVSPMNTPVMHPVNVRCHTFFVPNRIVWEGWEQFITGGNDGQGDGFNIVPRINTTGMTKKSVTAYLGIPPIDGVDISGLPLRAFNKIWNEYYRDQDLMAERTEASSNALPFCAWEKDYFTTARPWTQRGPDINLPVFGDTPRVFTDQGDLDQLRISDGQGGAKNVTVNQLGDPAVFGTTAGLGNLFVEPDAAQVSINDFRAGFALQRYQEARARYGARFTEYLRYLGITPSDARLQRPEFLGGGTTRLSFSEVLQTSPDAGRQPDGDIGVGDMYGHGIAGLSTGKWRRFFEEHGYVITVMSVRPKSIYMNGIPREFLKTSKEDFFQKELANLGQQEVYEAELYAENARNVFGYQDRYQEYRGQPSQISQDFRDTLNAFHLGRDLSPSPVLNQSFVSCNPSRRIFQVTDPTVDTLWCMVNNHLVARRQVPKRANPRIL